MKGQKCPNPSGYTKHIVDVKTGNMVKVSTDGQTWLCTAVSPPTRPVQLVLAFETRVGVRCNGRDVFCPIVVLGECGGSISVSRAGYKISLKVSYCPSANLQQLDNLDQGICSICHDPIQSGKQQQCPHCGCNYHPECLGPINHVLRCPACEKQTVWRSWDRSTISQRCLEFSQSPRHTVILVGCGNIGSKIALEVPMLGIKRVVLIDPDRICVKRNSKCCTLFASAAVQGQFKVDVLFDAIGKQNPQCEVIRLPMLLKQLNIAELRKFTPAILVGAVDSRRARKELAETAVALDVPLVDLAIAGSPDQLIARAQTTWTSVDGVSPLEMWSATDWQLIEEQVSCSASNDDGKHPVSSAISGALAAVLGLTQIKKLLAGDVSDIGWVIRIDLNTSSLIRSRLKSATHLIEQRRADRHANFSKASKAANSENSVAWRRSRRTENDIASLTTLAQARPNFSYIQAAHNIFLFKYDSIPGLLKTNHGVEVWSTWQAAVLLPAGYPLKPPVVMLRPVDKKGFPFHPNVRPSLPNIVCYGRHMPVLLLDELARRLERMINLEPKAITTDEADSLNWQACRYVRLLTREQKIPLTKNTCLPGNQQPEKVTKQGYAL